MWQAHYGTSDPASAAPDRGRLPLARENPYQNKGISKRTISEQNVLNIVQIRRKLSQILILINFLSPARTDGESRGESRGTNPMALIFPS